MKMKQTKKSPEIQSETFTTTTYPNTSQAASATISTTIYLLHTCSQSWKLLKYKGVQGITKTNLLLHTAGILQIIYKSFLGEI